MKNIASIRNRIIAGALIAVLVIAGMYSFSNFFTSAEVISNYDYSDLLSFQQANGNGYDYLIKNWDAEIGTDENPFTILEVVPERSMGMFGYYIPDCEPFSMKLLNDEKKLNDSVSLCKNEAEIYKKTTCTVDGKSIAGKDEYINMDLLVRAIFKGRSSYGEEGSTVVLDGETLTGGFRSQVITLTPFDFYLDDAHTVYNPKYEPLLQQADLIIFNQQLDKTNATLRAFYKEMWVTVFGGTYTTQGSSSSKFDAACDIPAEVVEQIFLRQAGIFGEYGFRKAAVLMDIALAGCGVDVNYNKLHFLMMSDEPAGTYSRCFPGGKFTGSSDTLLDCIKGTWSQTGERERNTLVNGNTHKISAPARETGSGGTYDKQFRQHMFEKNAIRDRSYTFGDDGDFWTKCFVKSGIAQPFKDEVYSNKVDTILTSSEKNDTALSFIHYVYGKINNYKNVLRILEVEPTTTLSDGKSAFRIKQDDPASINTYVGKSVGDWFEGRYEITNMTYGEFNTKKCDLQSEFDIIYLGTKGMVRIDDDGGVTFPDRKNGDWNGYNKYLLTCKRYIDLLSFSRVGAIVYLDSPGKSVNSKGETRWSGYSYRYLDTNEVCSMSYYYRLWAIHGSGSIGVSTYDKAGRWTKMGDSTLNIYYVGTDDTSDTASKNDINARYSSSVLPANKDNFNNKIKQVAVKVTGVANGMPENYIGVGSMTNTGGKSYTNNIVTNNNQLAFKVNVTGYNAGDYQFKLFVDKDGDGNFQLSTAKVAYLDNARYGEVNSSHRYSNQNIDFTVYSKESDGNWTALSGETITIPIVPTNNGVQQKAVTTQYLIVSQELDGITGYVPWQLELVKKGDTDAIDPCLVYNFGLKPDGTSYNIQTPDGPKIRGNIRNVLNGATWIKADKLEEIRVLQINTDAASASSYYESSDLLFNEEEVKNKYRIIYDHTSNPEAYNLFDYDVVVVGISALDGGQSIIGNKNVTFEMDLMKYIQSGKGIVFTQNSLNESHDDNYSLEKGFLVQDDLNRKRFIGTYATSNKKNVYDGESELRPYLNISNFLVDKGKNEDDDVNSKFFYSEANAVHFNNFGRVTSYPYYLNDCEVGPDDAKVPGIYVPSAKGLKYAVKIDLPNYVNNEVEVCDSDTYGTVMNEAYAIRGGDGANLSYLMSACNTYYLGFNAADYKSKSDTFEVSDAEKLFVNTLIAAYRKGRDVKLHCDNRDMTVDNTNGVAKAYLELYEYYAESVTGPADPTSLEVANNTSEITPDGVAIKLAIWVNGKDVSAEDKYEIGFRDYIDAIGNVTEETGNSNNQVATNKFAYHKLIDDTTNTGIQYMVGEGKVVSMDYANLVKNGKEEYDETNDRTRVGELTFHITRNMIDDCEGMFKLQLRPYNDAGWYWKPHEAYGVANYEIDILEMLMFNLN